MTRLRVAMSHLTTIFNSTGQPPVVTTAVGPRRLLLAGWLVGLALAAFSPEARSATNPLAAVSGPKTEAGQSQAGAPLSDEEIEASRLKLEARVFELRQQAGPDAVAALRATYQEAALPLELDEWDKLTNKLIGILDDHSTTLFRLKDYRKATHDKLEEMKAWKGFAEKPPYPISLLDSLSDALEAKQSVLRSLDIIRVTIENEFSEYSSALKNSSKQVRLAEEELEKNVGKPGEKRARWLLTLAQLQNAVNQAGAIYGETRRLSVTEMQKSAQADIDFLNRKLAVARSNHSFSEEELKKKIKAIDEQVTRYRQQLEQAKDNEKATRRQLDSAEAAVSMAQAAVSAGGRPKVPLEQLLREQKRRQVYFEDAGLRVLITNGMLQLLKSTKNVWEERYRIAGGKLEQEVPDELKNSRNEMDMISKWKAYVTNKLSVVEFNIKGQQEALASGTLTPAEREDARTFLGLYQAQEALLQRGILTLTNYEQLVQRRDEEARKEQVTLTGRAKGAFAQAASLIGKLWYTELYIAEETIIADNKKIIRPRSVTVGKVVEAVLLLFAGVWMIKLLKIPLRRVATHRFKMNINDAHLFTRLLVYIMFVIILVSALVFVNIPLAIFTFLGGALAIGIGFGAQTLINNFISGLILMFDRTIRMGDMVEVDGHRGRVTAIGMRSSSISRFDGVEMLVPNSVFLQQNVINWTSADPRARYTISVGVAYGSPTREVDRILRTAVADQKEVLHDPAPYVVFENFADSALTFTAYFWIELDPDVNSNMVFSDIRHRINERLAEAGIAIPFPQRDLHLAGGRPIEVKINQ